jgi:flagellar basal-body rod protein FlgG
MFNALQIAATGMQAEQTNVDTIANNLANVNTTGFKKARVNFTDLVSSQVNVRRGPLGEVESLSAGQSVGVAVSYIGRTFDPGEARRTDSTFDFMISGDGFLEVSMPDGGVAYLRGGTLSVNADGLLSTRGGLPLKPNIDIPNDIQKLILTSDGRVQIQTSRSATPFEAGRLDLVRFISTAGLQPMGDGLYKATTQAGEPISGRAAQDEFGEIRQGYLEASNVKMVDEMVSLMIAQRAYEASSKVIQASDEMLGMVNNLRK